MLDRCTDRLRRRGFLLPVLAAVEPDCIPFGAAGDSNPASPLPSAGPLLAPPISALLLYPSRESHDSCPVSCAGSKLDMHRLHPTRAALFPPAAGVPCSPMRSIGPALRCPLTALSPRRPRPRRRPRRPPPCARGCRCHCQPDRPRCRPRRPRRRCPRPRPPFAAASAAVPVRGRVSFRVSSACTLPVLLV